MAKHSFQGKSSTVLDERFESTLRLPWGTDRGGAPPPGFTTASEASHAGIA